MKNKRVAWFAVASWMAVVFFLSHQPAAVSSGLSSEISGFLLGIVGDLIPGGAEGAAQFPTFVRKNAHFFAYLILAVLLVNALGRWGRLNGRTFLAAFVISVVYAASDEFHQLFIEGRSGEVRDVMIDSAGAATGIAVCWVIYKLVDKRKKRNLAN